MLLPIHVMSQPRLARLIGAALACLSLALQPEAASNDVPGSAQLTRVPRRAWSDYGWLGVYLGMGPGDVIDLLASPASSLRAEPGSIVQGGHTPGDPDGFIRAKQTNLLLAGRRVDAVFLFHQERLYAVSVQAGTMLEWNAKADPEMRARWFRELEPKLRADFGEPNESDEARTLWRFRDATVELRGGSVELTHTPTSYKVKVERDAGNRAVRSTLANASALHRTPPKSWSTGGWEALKWGMGIGDVIDRIERADPDTDVFGDGNLPGETGLVTTLKGMVFGAAVTATVTFSDRLLSQIEFSPGVGLVSPRCIEQEAWFRKVVQEVTALHGPGRCVTSKSSGTEECEWMRHPALRVVARLIRLQESRCAASLEYGDPAGEPPPLSAKEMRAATSEASWKAGGWMGFRWGMGVADVSRVLRDSRGPFKAPPMICRASESAPGGALCSLESDVHSFNVAALQPGLEFDFRKGKLFGVYLRFFEQDHVAGRRAFENVGGILIAKYGASPALDVPPGDRAAGALGSGSWVSKGTWVNFHGRAISGRVEFSVEYMDSDMQFDLSGARPLDTDEREKL